MKGEFLDTGCFDAIDSIHEIKTGLTGKSIEKSPLFGLEIGFLVPRCSYLPIVLHICPNET